MRAIKTIFVLFVLMSALQLSADTIKVGLGGGRVSFRANNGGGQRLTFAGLTISTSDSANGTALTLSPGTGSFLFTTVSNGQGLFAPLTGASFTMGSTASGIASGSISSIVITGATRGVTTTTFTMQLTFSGMSFQNCSTANCVNSTTLKNFAAQPTGTLTASFSLPNATASTLAQLLAMNGNHNNLPMTGELDATVTPEPTTLALFGSGLVVFSLGIARRRKRSG